MSNMNRAIFFDRDGVLNRLINRDDGWYSPRKLANFKIIPNSIEATRQTSSLGYLNIVVSNQPDIARCHLKETELKMPFTPIGKIITNAETLEKIQQGNTLKVEII